MGQLWLPDLPDWLRARGLVVETWPGYLTRSRSSGGYDDIFAIGVHHDASNPKSTWQSAGRSMWETHEFRPVGALYLARDGRWVVGAAGATNTQGKGGPLQCSRGTIPLDSGNRYTISIEAGNNGVGEVWSQVQLDSYAEGVAGIIDGLRDVGAFHAGLGRELPLVLNPLVLHDVHAHHEWAPTRKIDPAGPPLSPVGFADPADARYRRWLMGPFRTEVAGRLAAPPDPNGGPVTVTAERMTYLPNFDKMFDSRPGEPAYHNPGLAHTQIGPSDGEVKVAVAFAHVAQIRVQVMNGNGPGYVSVSGIAGADSPLVNFAPVALGWGGDQVATLAVPEGCVYIRSPHREVDVIVSTAAWST